MFIKTGGMAQNLCAECAQQHASQAMNAVYFECETCVCGILEAVSESPLNIPQQQQLL
jgi:hypothetical protein